jgi:hypothetical protein
MAAFTFPAYVLLAVLGRIVIRMRWRVAVVGRCKYPVFKALRRPGCVRVLLMKGSQRRRRVLEEAGWIERVIRVATLPFGLIFESSAAAVNSRCENLRNSPFWLAINIFRRWRLLVLLRERVIRRLAQPVSVKKILPLERRWYIKLVIKADFLVNPKRANILRVKPCY